MNATLNGLPEALHKTFHKLCPYHSLLPTPPHTQDTIVPHHNTRCDRSAEANGATTEGHASDTAPIFTSTIRNVKGRGRRWWEAAKVRDLECRIAGRVDHRLEDRSYVVYTFECSD
jgi:hypothetical protein